MSDSVELFADHPVNRRREQAGHLPATNVWLWGQGRAPSLAPFADTYGLQGAMITAVDLLRGLAALIGWDRIEVPGATGYTDTDYAAKGRYAIDALDKFDIVCVHVEATDEASHEGDCAAKIKALEEIDEKIVAPLAAAMRERDGWRILITPDHPTPLRTKTHSHGAVPFVIAGSDVTPDEHEAYSDEVAANSTLAFEEGWKMMGRFVGRRTCGSVGLWDSGTLGLWVCGFVGLWVVGLWVCGFVGLTLIYWTRVYYLLCSRHR